MARAAAFSAAAPATGFYRQHQEEQSVDDDHYQRARCGRQEALDAVDGRREHEGEDPGHDEDEDDVAEVEQVLDQVAAGFIHIRVDLVGDGGPGLGGKPHPDIPTDLSDEDRLALVA